MNRVIPAAVILALFSGCSNSTADEESVKLTTPPGIEALPDPENPADDLDLVRLIRKHILDNSLIDRESQMQDYRWAIPKTGVPYDMVAIPGGEFLMGSPPDESGRNQDEGPQRKVEVAPFWMGKFEVSWDLYEPFMITDQARDHMGVLRYYSGNETIVDVVTSPTTPYSEMSFGMGIEGFPAICMTHHAASKFCQWLSAQTGHFYRLPTEAEWEYACRAGTTGPYHCPPEKLEDYAVIDPKQIRTGYAKIGTKKPNPWGLHDMHGNVFEWCLDQYFADGYRTGRPAVPAKKRYPRVARGGSWWDTAEFVRSAARLPSSEDWQQQDPQLPSSLWYLTDADWLGFRIVRPLEIPSAEEMEALWNSGRILSTDPDLK